MPELAMSVTHVDASSKAVHFELAQEMFQELRKHEQTKFDFFVYK
jgi:hypothetical protein